jgi:hypothetical protein
MGTDLITLAEFKAYAGINSTNQDSTINTIIPKVSALVKSYCRTTFKDFITTAKVEVFRSSYNGTLQLEELPLKAIGSVEFSEDFGRTYTSLVEFTDYVIDPKAQQLELIPEGYKNYNRVNAFRVSYTAGYDVLPEDLKLGIFDLVSYYLQHDVSVHSPKNVGSNNVQIEYIASAQLPSHIRRVLTLYSASYL